MFSFASLFHRSSGFGLQCTEDGVGILEINAKTLKQTQAGNAVSWSVGAFEDGKIQDQALAASCIRKAYETMSPRPPRTKRCVVSLPIASTFVWALYLEKEINEKDLRSTAFARSQELFPVDLGEYVWDMEVRAHTKEESIVLCAAAPKDLVALYAHTVALAGYEIMALEPEILAVVRAIRAMQKNGDLQPTLVIYMQTDWIYILCIDAVGVQSSVPLARSVQATADPSSSAAQRKGVRKVPISKKTKSASVELPQQFGDEMARASEWYVQSFHRPIASIVVVGEEDDFASEAMLKGVLTDASLTFLAPPFAVKGISRFKSVSLYGSAIRASQKDSGINFLRSV